eukprot:NODE_3482_length_2029_cov_5.595163.p1 GENE.NODE_3482_length_2029_cov_5.595163~~NODE_3482_length_2029_cov_5.595163.p1  ORF type:complete len:627 (-),score=161.82 NODE_3482_length_2029_cov_5.595163:84-1964(-)
MVITAFHAYRHKRNRAAANKPKVERFQKTRSSSRLSSPTEGQLACAWVLDSRCIQNLVSLEIVTNVAIVVYETDQGASHPSIGPFEGYQRWLMPMNIGYAAFFTTELVLRIFTERYKFWEESSNVWDFFVITVDNLCIILDLVLAGRLPSFTVLRVFRLLKVSRAIRFFQRYRELYILVTGLVSAMKAVFGGLFMIAFVLLVWAVVAVTFVHPINLELQEQGYYDDCERCGQAYASCWKAWLTLWQTIVAGDSWGTASLPIIDHSPFTALIFMGALGTVQLGIMNLVVGSIVDTIEGTRLADIDELLRQKKQQQKECKDELLKLCQAMDTDGSGSLTLDEVQVGYLNNEGFNSQMKFLDIDYADLNIVFNIMDGDESGDVDFHEFVEELHKLKAQDTHTLLIFMRYHLLQLRKQVSENVDTLHVQFEEVVQKLAAEQSATFERMVLLLAGEAPLAASLMPPSVLEKGISCRTFAMGADTNTVRPGTSPKVSSRTENEEPPKASETKLDETLKAAVKTDKIGPEMAYCDGCDRGKEHEVHVAQPEDVRSRTRPAASQMVDPFIGHVLEGLDLFHKRATAELTLVLWEATRKFGSPAMPRAGCIDKRASQIASPKPVVCEGWSSSLRL